MWRKIFVTILLSQAFTSTLACFHKFKNVSELLLSTYPSSSGFWWCERSYSSRKMFRAEKFHSNKCSYIFDEVKVTFAQKLCEAFFVNSLCIKLRFLFTRQKFFNSLLLQEILVEALWCKILFCKMWWSIEKKEKIPVELHFNVLWKAIQSSFEKLGKFYTINCLMRLLMEIFGAKQKFSIATSASFNLSTAFVLGKLNFEAFSFPCARALETVLHFSFRKSLLYRSLHGNIEGKSISISNAFASGAPGLSLTSNLVRLRSKTKTVRWSEKVCP